MSDISPLYSELRDYAGKKITFAELGKRAQRKLGAQAMDRVMDELIVGANDIRNDIVKGMRDSPPTGKLYFKRWAQRKNKKGGTKKTAVFHRASSPGFPPRPDTGDLIGSIVMDARWAEVEVGSRITNPAYPKWLEEGTENIEARPWLWPAATANMPRIKAAITRRLREIAAEMGG